ncbi:MAG: trehalase family glycosidase, partial [Candidatus Daviesbacteria bacterium]
SLFLKQFDNGLIPHMVYWKRINVFNDIWGKKGTSSITQPPMVAYAVEKIIQKEKNNDFLQKVYHNLYHFYRYLLTERDPHERHLIGILNPDESGEDNSPRFDVLLKLPPVHSFKGNYQQRLKLVAQNIDCKFDAPFCMRNFFWVKDVPFNSIMVENLKVLSRLAEKLGYEDDAIYFKAKEVEITQAMRKLMLEDGVFWSTYGEDYVKIKIKTWAIFTPLFAQILTQEEAKELVEKHLLNKSEFWAKFPVPTVSMDEPSFNPKGFWRGPTWIAVNWFIYKGLINYGFNDIALQIKKSSLELLEKSGFREYFNPQTGEGLGAKNFTWGALVLDME